MGGAGRGSELRHQRAELRPLQNLRHQGPEPEHRLGGAGGRWRAELPEHVMMCYAGLPRCRHTPRPAKVGATRHPGVAAGRSMMPKCSGVSDKIMREFNEISAPSAS